MKFETAVELYWADKSRRLRGNTLEGYASAIRRHLMPAWSGRELESITHDEVQAWVWLNVLPTMDLYSLGRKRTPWLALSGTILEPLKSLGGLDASWDTESYSPLMMVHPMVTLLVWPAPD